VKSPVTLGVNQRLHRAAVDGASNTGCCPASMLIRWVGLIREYPQVASGDRAFGAGETTGGHPIG
jgi:hypothetical protein